MPLFMDVHSLDDVTVDAVAQAHQADLATQGPYCVDYKSYWFDEGSGKTREVTVPKELAGWELWIYQVGTEARQLPPDRTFVPWKSHT